MLGRYSDMVYPRACATELTERLQATGVEMVDQQTTETVWSVEWAATIHGFGIKVIFEECRNKGRTTLPFPNGRYSARIVGDGYHRCQTIVTRKKGERFNMDTVARAVVRRAEEAAVATKRRQEEAEARKEAERMIAKLQEAGLARLATLRPGPGKILPHPDGRLIPTIEVNLNISMTVAERVMEAINNILSKEK